MGETRKSVVFEFVAFVLSELELPITYSDLQMRYESLSRMRL